MPIKQLKKEFEEKYPQLLVPKGIYVEEKVWQWIEKALKENTKQIIQILCKHEFKEDQIDGFENAWCRKCKLTYKDYDYKAKDNLLQKLCQ